MDEVHNMELLLYRNIHSLQRQYGETSLSKIVFFQRLQGGASHGHRIYLNQGI